MVVYTYLGVMIGRLMRRQWQDELSRPPSTFIMVHYDRVTSNLFRGVAGAEKIIARKVYLYRYYWCRARNPFVDVSFGYHPSPGRPGLSPVLVQRWSQQLYSSWRRVRRYTPSRRVMEALGRWSRSSSRARRGTPNSRPPLGAALPVCPSSPRSVLFSIRVQGVSNPRRRKISLIDFRPSSHRRLQSPLALTLGYAYTNTHYLLPSFTDSVARFIAPSLFISLGLFHTANPLPKTTVTC